MISILVFIVSLTNCKSESSPSSAVQVYTAGYEYSAGISQAKI